MKFRLLRPDEIEVRVGTINEKGATLLLYKDARVDMNILDESGEIWKREHFSVNNNLFCRVSIYSKEISDWVEREDVGVESNTEATKGEASDSFKRACFNWGIGRELYTAPFTWIAADKYSSFKNPKTGKLATYDKFSVKTIGYDEERRVITSLEIVNDKTNQTVFTYGLKVERQPAKQASGADQEVLARAKAKINSELGFIGYGVPESKRAFIRQVLEKSTIDTLDDADLVMDALDNVKQPA